MYNSFFALDALVTPAAFVAAMVIGFFFGFALEKAGFGSSRKLAGIFYFRDMTVLKVMFSGVIVSMLGVIYLIGFGLISFDSIFWLPTKYWAQILGGLLFGIGFVVGGWCPGTAAVGMASGKLDAVIFLVGSVIGSLIFNEAWPLVEGMFNDSSGVVFVWQSLGVQQGTFALLFTVIAVAAFWFAETAEYIVSDTGIYLNSRFLKGYSVLLLALAVGAIPFFPVNSPANFPAGSGSQLSDLTADMAVIEGGKDHISPAELADTILSGKEFLLVDLRPEDEYSFSHLPKAVNASLEQLESEVRGKGSGKPVVLYSNGMVHPAQGRSLLVAKGFTNVLILSDGLNGFYEQVLKPASLRSYLVSDEESARIRIWRQFFSSGKKVQ
jgi:thiosulfate/3-mercaptopyruvate sulfurtransferase